jgi:hypothetical protein
MNRLAWVETRVNGDVHGGQRSCGSGAGASRFLIGLVTRFATHDGIPAVGRSMRRVIRDAPGDWL